jgi:hypothetical protein
LVMLSHFRICKGENIAVSPWGFFNFLPFLFISSVDPCSVVCSGRAEGKGSWRHCLESDPA